MSFTNYLAQLQQPRAPIGPDPEMERMGMLAAALEKGQQWEAAQAEKRRLLAKEEAAAKIAAEDRRIKTAESDVERRQKMASQFIGAGNNDMAMKIYNGAGGSLEALNLPFQQMVGGQRALTNEQAAAQPGKVEDLFSYDAQGNFRPSVQDAMNPQSLAMLQGFSGYKPEYKSYNSDDDIYDQRGELVRKGVPKPTFFANGAGMYNQQTGKVDSTGFTPPMTPAQQAADADRDRTFDYRSKQDAVKQAWQKQVQSVRTAQDVGKAKARINEQAIRLFTDRDGNYDAAGAQVWKEGQTALIDGWFEQNKGKAAAAKNDTAASTSADKNRNASKQAERALTSVLGGGPGYLAFSMAYPGAHAQLLEFYRRRGMGDKTAVMPYTGEQIREMRDTANSPNPPRPGTSTPAAPQGTPTVRPAPAGSNTMRFQINNAELSPRVASILSDLGMA